MGNCMYDKKYGQEIIKVKVPSVRVLSRNFNNLNLNNNKIIFFFQIYFKTKFSVDELYRKPEFAEILIKIVFKRWRKRLNPFTIKAQYDGKMC